MKLLRYLLLLLLSLHLVASASFAAITFINSCTGTNTCTLPAHLVNDAIICFAFRDGSNTAPSVPAGEDWTTAVSSGANTCAAAAVYKLADTTTETTGTFTNATSVICHVYRNTHINVIGFSSSAGSTTNTINYPTLDPLDNVSGSSWAIGFTGHRNIDTTIDSQAPSGMIARTSVVDATDEAASFDTNGGVVSWPSTNVTITGTTGNSRTITLELLGTTTTTTSTTSTTLQTQRLSSQGVG